MRSRHHDAGLGGVGVGPAVRGDGVALSTFMSAYTGGRTLFAWHGLACGLLAPALRD